MSAADAWLQGGAALLLVIFAAAVIRYLYLDNKVLRDRIDTLTDTSLTLLTEYQKRDAEELKELRRQRDMELRR